MMNPMSLKNRKIFITGASSGIGKATAIYCANLGAQVVLHGRNIERLEKTKKQLSGNNHIICVQDFNTNTDWENIFNDIICDGIKLDGLVHCAGVPCIMPIKSLTKERLSNVMNINFYSFVELARFFVKRKYSNDYSSIVGISSSAVLHPRMYELGYLASKAAMEISIPVMAQEFFKRNIRVNCVSPGSVMTEMISSTLNEHNNKDVLDYVTSQSIMGWQEPEEIAKVCSFLLSNESKAITAKIIRADGGIF